MDTALLTQPMPQPIASGRQELSLHYWSCCRAGMSQPMKTLILPCTHWIHCIPPPLLICLCIVICFYIRNLPRCGKASVSTWLAPYLRTHKLVLLMGSDELFNELPSRTVAPLSDFSQFKQAQIPSFQPRPPSRQPFTDLPSHLLKYACEHYSLLFRGRAFTGWIRFFNSYQLL